MQRRPIVILGGGPAGLSTAGALKRLGHSALILDRNERTGSSWLERYDRLHLHTVRGFSRLAHLPIPRRYPKYLSREMYAEYLQHYAQAFDLEIVHGCEVDALERSAGNAFLIRSSAGEIAAGAVVVATGMYAQPLFPASAGLDDYRGIAMHAQKYRNGSAFEGMRVLVVGMGNSGAEIAADLVEHNAAFVALSLRTPPPVVPRDVAGVPVQLFGIALSHVPPGVADRTASLIARLALGDLSRYGLPAAQWRPFSANRIPVIDAGFVRHLRCGRIAMRPPAAQFDAAGVTFPTGARERYDAVIFATGYSTGLERWLHVPGALNEDGVPISGCGEAACQPGLYFMGFIQSHRGVLYEIAHASVRLARTIAATAASNSPESSDERTEFRAT